MRITWSGFKRERPRNRLVYTGRCNSRPFEAYPIQAVGHLGLDVVTKWRVENPDALLGHYILLDNWWVVEVRDYNYVITPNIVRKMRRLPYAFLPYRAGSNGRLRRVAGRWEHFDDAIVTLAYLRDMYTPLLPVETLVLDAFWESLDLAEAIRSVYGRLKDSEFNRVFDTITCQEFVGVMNDQIRQAFQEAGVKPSEIVTRMNGAASTAFNKLMQLGDDPDTKVSEFVQLLMASNAIDAKLLDTVSGVEQGQNGSMRVMPGLMMPMRPKRIAEVSEASVVES